MLLAVKYQTTRLIKSIRKLKKTENQINLQSSFILYTLSEIQVYIHLGNLYIS